MKEENAGENSMSRMTLRMKFMPCFGGLLLLAGALAFASVYANNSRNSELDRVVVASAGES